MGESTIGHYLDALSRHDGVALQACYHRQSSFSDPIHPDLRGEQLIWLLRFRLSRIETLQAEARSLAGDERKGHLRWVAHWRPRGGAESGRIRRLEIHSTFTFWEGRIVRQVDEYATWAFMRQVHGLSGWLLGWLPGRLAREQERAAGALNRYIGEQTAAVDARSTEEIPS